MICAKSFARIFFRNAINLGIPLFTIHENITKKFTNGERIHYTINPPIIKTDTHKQEVKLAPFPDFFYKILQKGGAIEILKEFLRKNN